jgi:hypothetical protein
VPYYSQPVQCLLLFRVQAKFFQHFSHGSVNRIGKIG